MKVGQYVRCPIVFEENDNYFPRNFVLGKIIAINDLSGEVSVRFYDLKDSKRFYAHAFEKGKFAIDKVKRCGAAKDAPVVTPDGRGKILSRRIKQTKDALYEYYVMLSTGEINSYFEDALEIEYSASDYQPLKQMMRYEFQNPIWYANRLHVSNNMHMVNNTVYGFKELAGCRTYLMAHQISAIVRAFESRPIRYMLADEVGLGKTVEAASIIKILSSEKQDLRVLYIVPAALAQQWANELKYKFNINALLGDAMAAYAKQLILSLEDLDEYCDALTGKWDMLLVDETHRLLSQEEKYKLVLRLSKSVQNALFLSATPIQDRKEEYLKLLSLLQPDQYCRMTVKEFDSILSNQKKIQRRVNAMLSHMNQYDDYKEDTQEKLVELAEKLEDTHLSKIVEGINIADCDGGQKFAEQALSYICENYRIERNVIRNRRDYINEALGKRELHKNGYDVKNAGDNYSERNVYYALLEYISAKIGENSIEAEEVYLLLQAMFSSPWALKDIVEDLGIDDQDLKANLGLWITQADDEINQAEYLLDENPDEIKGRLLHVIDFIEQEVKITKDNNGKVVVFSEFPATLWKLGELLEKRDLSAVCFTSNMLQEELEHSVYDFQNNEKCRVILCDAAGGEGRNFQNADWVIHIDLPWTANAIEQRIGRLDRLGRDQDHMQVNSVVFYGNGTIEEQLFRIWNEGLNLFDRSLSGLEIITAELNERISDAIFEDVHNGLENALSEIIDMTEETRDAVEEEQLYDSGSVIYRSLSLAVKQMLSTYSGGESDLFQSSMLGWATQVGLGSSSSKAGVVQFASSMFKERSAIQSLFIPPDWALYDDTPIVRKEGRILGTFDRSTAIKREDLLFYAPGDPVFDSIIGNAVDSGRGRCCVFANMAPFNYTGFACVYNVEPRINYLYDNGIPIQLLSQFRMYLPMKQVIVFVSMRKGDNVSDEELMDYIFEKTNVQNADHIGQRTGKRGKVSSLERFMEAYPESEWQETVRKAGKISRDKAKKKAIELADLEGAKREIDRIVSGYESEYIYLGKEMDSLNKIKTQYDAVYYALSNPVISLDSISLMFLTRG
ncbi:MAG: DEAD/DEAH box helicase family protein [Hungatella sp.]|nr:DEAD/DEAH box helicase family protein [Hungatella sp.]